MKQEKIKELFEKYHSTCYDAMEARHVKVLLPDDLTRTVKQVEKELKLEWYKKLLSKLEFIYGSDLKVFGTIIDKNANNYYNEIQNKIKEMENEN